ncbi:unnamed protein product [Lathyrus sativus]|nr:unnamed protein product [Lathyrus sativus]
MIMSWNIMGLNKVGKLRDISSHLLELKPAIVILIEARVKKSKAKVIREKLHMNNNFWKTIKIMRMVEFGRAGMIVELISILCRVLVNLFIVECMMQLVGSNTG